MAMKASLRIRLLANDVIVAESEDSRLWQQVLGAIQGASTEADAAGLGLAAPEIQTIRTRGSNSPIASFSAEIGVDVTTIEGSFGPSIEPPYLHLDTKCWEAFKKNTPSRGAKAVSAIQLAATILCLWFPKAGIDGHPTQAQAKVVLDILGASDKNPSRAIKNCTWLQARGDGIRINPAEISKAHTIARAFATKSPVTVKE